MAKQRVALIDGNALVFRAFYALPTNLKTTWGLHTNAVYGFAQMFRKVLAGKTPAYGAVIFDAPGGTFRDAISPDYKANRQAMPQELVAQLPWIDTLVEAHNFPILRVRGFEADDVIGTLTREAAEAGHEVLIVSGDKDFAQLVGPDVRVFDPTKEVWYDAALVQRKWGVRPDQFVDYLALVGDKIDNIPGVPGIGKKGAAQLLTEHESLQALLARLPELKGRGVAALRTHRDQALVSQRLARIDCQVPLGEGVESLVLEPPTIEQLNAVYRKLEFFSLLSAEALEEVGQGRREAVQYFICDTPDTARSALQELEAAPHPVGVHALVELPGHLRGALVGLAVAVEPRRALYFPFRGPQATLGSYGLQLLKRWLESSAHPKAVHMERRLWGVLRRHGVTLAGVAIDTALASYLLDPTEHQPHRLEQVARAYLHRALQPLRGVIGGGTSRRDFADLPLGRAGAYACHLADAVVELAPVLERRVKAAQLHAQLTKREMPLSAVLAEMELDGIGVDSLSLEQAGRDFAARRDAVEHEIFSVAGRRFNVGSQRQLGQVLFEELGLPILKRTKTGYSTDAETMERLKPRHEIVELVLRWRTLAKLINTYTDVLLAAIHPKTRRIHCTIQQTASASGRLITTDPDLQRTPVRTPEFRRLREAFVASEGNQLLSADWSQIELRILAHFSADPLLAEAYRRGVDVHRQTASHLFDIAPDAVSAAQREIGKTVNFATIYGQGATALGRQLGLPRNQAKAYIDRFFTAYAGVTAWREQVVYEAHSRGYVTTLLGRRRYIPQLSARNHTDRAYGERIATNTPIQGSAADICKVAMLNLHRALRRGDFTARMVLQIHDELLFDTPPEEVESLEALVKREMETVLPLDVPLVVDIGVGRSWEQAH